MTPINKSLKQLRKQVAQEKDIIKRKAEKKRLERELKMLRFQQTKVGRATAGLRTFSENIQRKQRKGHGKSGIKKFRDFSNTFSSNIDSALKSI